jgi:hypothetical protein
VALAIAAEPVHEAGHALAARILTGAWPHVGFWAVHPTAPFKSAAAVLGVLAAGDVAIVFFWSVILVVTRRRPPAKWVLIGPTFMAALALLNWLTAAILTPFGYGHLGASDAAKFIAFSGFNPWLVATFVVAISGCIAMAAARQFRSDPINAKFASSRRREEASRVGSEEK